MTKLSNNAGGFKARLHRDLSGSVLPISAVAMVVLVGMIGGGVDMSRAYMVQNRLQNACDSGVLAGRRAVDADGFSSAAEARADAFFETNFDEDNQGVTSTSFVVASADNGNTVTGVASTTVETVVVGLFGFDELPLTVNCHAAMSVGNSDVTMVLDVTGSMGWSLDGSQTRIEALRTSMKQFYDTVEAAADGGNARLRYSFVPYSSGVNVGSLLINNDPNFIVDDHTIQSKEPVFTETEVEEFSGWGTPYTVAVQNSDGNYNFGSWFYHTGSYRNNGTCKSNLPNDTSWANDGDATSSTSAPYINSSGQRVTSQSTVQKQTRTEYECYRQSRRSHWVIRRTETRDLISGSNIIEDPNYTTTTTTEFDRWNYTAVNYDTSSLKNFSSVSTPTGPDGTDETSVWEGCVEERETVSASSFSYSALLGLTPSGAKDLDIDSVPTNDDDTKWKPMWSDVVYYRKSQNGYLTSSPNSEYGNASSSFCPKAAQLLTTMSKGEFDAYADQLEPAGATYHSIGMIWGARLASPNGIFASNVTIAPSNGGEVARHIIFMTDGEMSTNYAIQTAYGVEWHDRRVTDNGYSNNDDRHEGRFLAACEIAKSKGIRVWVIAFASGLTGALETCASDDSAFTAATADQLNNAFQEIAKDVGELRITQ